MRYRKCADPDDVVEIDMKEDHGVLFFIANHDGDRTKENHFCKLTNNGRLLVYANRNHLKIKFDKSGRIIVRKNT